ncbi:peptidoglycan recognition protein family protein [Allokutzneria albata]|uniref:N-acetylmuramoyl-L-alanine amidase n=1 Tax=Allokutzneria albata TaxID=211114 RepID=A0A1H0DVT0_ALLAB|nr:N-acetylmuramoyl-L-alanine amidase [Allokutzneria albata]SDN74091.1 N-acetylmuramoyl-L-alanine amidase [Allokutzneria albata]
MAYSLTWMPGVLREAGLNVVEIGGWQNRGHGNFSDVRGVLLHHTAGPASGNFPSQNVVVNGRPGLAGPLCNLGLGRDGTWFIVAAGAAYHAGSGYVGWCGRDNGNNHLIGVEAESTGRGDWTAAQHESYPRGVAALLDHVGLPADRALAHKEWAPGRKIDPAGWPGDMGGFRGSVDEWMTGDGMPSPEEIATAVWSHILAQPDKPENKQAAWVWLTFANVAAWKSADALTAPRQSEVILPDGKRSTVSEPPLNFLMHTDAAAFRTERLALAILQALGELDDVDTAALERVMAERMDAMEASLAARLSALVQSGIRSLSDEDVRAIALAAADEEDARERARLGSAPDTT